MPSNKIKALLITVAGAAFFAPLTATAAVDQTAVSLTVNTAQVSSGNIAPGASTPVSISCPSGSVPVSGGFNIVQVTGGTRADAYIRSSLLDLSANGWSIGIENIGTAGITVTVGMQVTCAERSISLQ